MARARSDEDRLPAPHELPFSFGSLHNVRIAWHQLDSFGGGMFRRWLENSLLYAFSGTALTLLTSIPAGYGLAHGRFPGAGTSSG